MKAGVIGLGAMGYPMAKNLGKVGLLAAVWNRSPETASACGRETGAAVATDPADLARRCDVVITCVSADADLLAVIDAMLPGVNEGMVVADTSTVSSDTAREAAGRLKAVPAWFLDTPVSGGVEGARNGRLSVMAGGDEVALDRARPVLEAISARIVHMGAVGAGQATKAVNQIMVAGIMQGVSDGLAFGQAMGLDLERVIEVVGAGAAANWYLEHRGPTMIKDSYGTGFKLALHHKDLSIARDMAASHGVRLSSIEETLPLYETLIADGYGDEDISALFRVKKRLFEDT